MLKEGTPRHEQISSKIRKQIRSGEYKIDEKLPSENELTERFDVSRVTVRHALQTLESENLIYRCQGLGSFVKDNRSHHSPARLTDFVEDMRKAGKKAASKVLRLKAVEASEKVTSILNIKEGSKVVRLDRLRLGDGEPIAFDITWMPMFYGQLIENFDLTSETIHRILEHEYDIPVAKGCYRIEAENADEYVARHLEVNQGDALMLLNRLSYTIGEKPIYYQKRYYRTDRMVYELSVERQPGEGEPHSKMPLKEFVPVFDDELT